MEYLDVLMTLLVLTAVPWTVFHVSVAVVYQYRTQSYEYPITMLCISFICMVYVALFVAVREIMAGTIEASVMRSMSDVVYNVAVYALTALSITACTFALIQRDRVDVGIAGLMILATLSQLVAHSFAIWRFH